jgi:hypothetical protein
MIGRRSGGLPSAARRRRYAPTPFQASLRLRFTFPARRPQTEASLNRTKPRRLILCIRQKQDESNNRTLQFTSHGFEKEQNGKNDALTGSTRKI